MDAMHVVRVRARSVLAMLFLAVTANAFAQGAGNSTVSGTIVDNTGVVPGAMVTLTELATKVVRTNTTNETGVFRFAALRPGQYSLKVELQGFKPVVGRHVHRRRGRDSRSGQADALGRQCVGDRRCESGSHPRAGDLERAPGPRSPPTSWPTSR